LIWTRGKRETVFASGKKKKKGEKNPPFGHTAHEKRGGLRGFRKKYLGDRLSGITARGPGGLVFIKKRGKGGTPTWGQSPIAPRRGKRRAQALKGARGSPHSEKKKKSTPFEGCFRSGYGGGGKEGRLFIILGLKRRGPLCLVGKNLPPPRRKNQTRRLGDQGKLFVLAACGVGPSEGGEKKNREAEGQWEGGRLGASPGEEKRGGTILSLGPEGKSFPKRWRERKSGASSF